MKVINFGAGPAKLPNEVLEQARRQMTDWNGHGIGVMELSHRGPEFLQLLHQTESLVRDLLNVPSNYCVLFLPGGASGQFAGIPLNLMGRRINKSADYIVTGHWSEGAAKEASKYGKVNLVLPPSTNYTTIPDQSLWNLDPDASYLHYCANETIHGVEFHNIPDISDEVPLVCDMSSNIMSRPIDVSKFSLIYAGAQKNLGCAGVTLVIVREDLLGLTSSQCPSVLDYSVQYKAESCFNTPPTYSIYVMMLFLQWISAQGGLAAMDQLSSTKSQLIYNVVDSSRHFYVSPVSTACRSRMNIPFRLQSGDSALEADFLREAEQRGMLQLKGHRSVGGIRASLYNAITVDETRELADFMVDFQAKHC